MTERMRAWVHLAAGLVVTLFFGWLLLRQLDADHLVAALSALTTPSLLSALVLLAVGYMARIARWWLMLRPLRYDLALSDCVRPFLASIALNNVLPLRAGDALRVFGFRSQLKLGSPQLFGSLVVERLLDLGVLMLFFVLGVALLPAGALPAGLDEAASWLLPAALVALCLSLLAVIYAVRRRKPGTTPLENGPPDKRDWRTIVTQSLDVLRHLQSVTALLPVALLSLLAWVFEGAVFVVIAQVMIAGIPPVAPWFSLAAGTLATLLPSAPGHLGTFDFFTAQAMVAYGAAAGAAAAFAIVVHVVLWLPLTITGLLLLAFGGHPWQRIAASRSAARRQG